MYIKSKDVGQVGGTVDAHHRLCLATGSGLLARTLVRPIAHFLCVAKQKLKVQFDAFTAQPHFREIGNPAGSPS